MGRSVEEHRAEEGLQGRKEKGAVNWNFLEEEKVLNVQQVRGQA
jgi:hypothetical protein